MSAARWLAAIGTFGVSEAVRAIDEKTGDALINASPAGALGNAIDNQSLGPLMDAGRLDKVVTAATRNVPVVNSVSGFATSTFDSMRDAGSVLNLGGAGIINRGPQQTPDDTAYAAALVSHWAYKDYSDRPSVFEDKRGRKWKELDGWTNDKMAIYTCGSMCIVGFRGTKLDDKDDVIQDMDLVFLEGLVNAVSDSGRTKLSSPKVREMVEKYSKVILTGHSLGGFIAYQLSLEHKDVTAHLFNAGAAGVNPLHHTIYAFINIPDRATHHHIRGDLFSTGFSEALATRKTYNCSFDYPLAHSMGHFILPEHR